MRGLAVDRTKSLQISAQGLGLLAHFVDACLVAFAGGAHQAVGNVINLEGRFRCVQHRTVCLLDRMDGRGVGARGRAMSGRLLKRVFQR